MTLELWRNKDEIAVDGFKYKLVPSGADLDPDARIVVEKALLHVPGK